MRQKSEQKRQAILDAAVQLFGEVGLERGTMSDIAAVAGLTKATVYNYFKSKEELFFEVTLRWIQLEMDTIHRALDSESDDITHDLQRYGESFLNLIYSREVQVVRRLVIAEANRSKFGKLCSTQGPERGKAQLAGFIEKAMQDGKLRRADSLVAAHQLSSLLEAELITEFQFGRLEAVDTNQIGKFTERAVAAFMAIYKPLDAGRD